MISDVRLEQQIVRLLDIEVGVLITLNCVLRTWSELWRVPTLKASAVSYLHWQSVMGKPNYLL